MCDCCVTNSLCHICFVSEHLLILLWLLGTIFGYFRLPVVCLLQSSVLTDMIFFPFLTLSLEVNSFSSLCEDFLREAFVCVTISSFLNTTLTSSEPQNHQPALPVPLSSQILQKVANYLWPSSAAKTSFSAQIMFVLHCYFPKPPESVMLTGGKEKGSHGFHLQVAYKRLIND